MSEVLKKVRNSAGIAFLAGAVMVGSSCSTGKESARTGSRHAKAKSPPELTSTTLAPDSLDPKLSGCVLDATASVNNPELSGKKTARIAMGFKFYNETTVDGIFGTQILINPGITVCESTDGSSLRVLNTEVV